MSITKVTLAKESNTGIEYLYPKTTSDIVEYNNITVKEKLDSLDDGYNNIVNNIVNDINNIPGILEISKGGTSANTAPVALYNLSWHTVTENMDLNEFIGTEHMGYYYFGSAYIPANAPVNARGYLIFIRGGGSQRKQIWINQGGSGTNQNGIYVRSYDNYQWTTWNTISKNVALVGSDDANNTGWHKVASGTLSGYSNTSIMFAVHDTKSYVSGILNLDIRCATSNGSDAIVTDSSNAQRSRLTWLITNGINENSAISFKDFMVVVNGTTWTMYYSVKQRYYRMVFEVIEESSINTGQAQYTLYSNQTKYSGDLTATFISESADISSIHPRYTDHDIGFYKVSVDEMGHVDSVSNVTLSDITNLGVPTTHYNAYIYTGIQDAVGNTTTNTSNPYITVTDKEGTTAKHTSSIQLKGSGATNISANNGIITINTPSMKTLTINGNGTKIGDYNGSADKTINITPSNIGAAISDHTHTTTLATDTGTSNITLGYGSKYKLSTGGTSTIFTMPSLGTSSTTAAAGNHTHSTVTESANGFMSSNQFKTVRDNLPNGRLYSDTSPTDFGSNSTAIGGSNVASGTYSIAIGYNNKSNDYCSIAMGNSNTASKSNSVAIGNSNTSSNSYAYSIGRNNTVSGENSIAIGAAGSSEKNNVSGTKSVAIGAYNTVSGNNSVAIGIGTHYGNAEDTNTLTGNWVYVIGTNNSATNSGIRIFGADNTASGGDSYIIGRQNDASGSNSYAIGRDNKPSKSNSYAIGQGNISSGEYSYAIGRYCKASAEKAFSIGEGINWSTGLIYNTASGERSMAIGFENNASGLLSFAIGNNSIASGSNSIAIGTSVNWTWGIEHNEAIGEGSVAIGGINHTTAIRSFAFGYKNNVNSQDSIALGCNSTTSGGIANLAICGGTAKASKNEVRKWKDSGSWESDSNKADIGGRSLALGLFSEAIAGSSVAIGTKAISKSIGQFTCGFAPKDENFNSNGSSYYNNTSGTVFAIGNGYYAKAYGSDNSTCVTLSDDGTTVYHYTKSNIVRIENDTNNGHCYLNADIINPGADYAEFVKEWWDGNPNNEDRVGYMVTIGDDNKLHKANEGDYIIGITSGNPSVIGNGDEDYYWMYERDRFNRIVTKSEIVTEPKIDNDGNQIFDDNGNPIYEEKEILVKKLSSSYDKTKKYICRSNRPEWDYVGMRGIVPCRDDGTCVPRGFCKCGSDGTKAETRGFDTYYVIERIDDETISVEVK